LNTPKHSSKFYMQQIHSQTFKEILHAINVLS
jgi:hypothetical protein